MSRLRTCVAGATGSAGSELSKGIFDAVDMELVAAVYRSHAGKVLGEALGVKELCTPKSGTLHGIS